jgi:pyruvate formate lyase activating enzyme
MEMSGINGSNFGIKGFIPTSMVDWPGILSSVIFIGGCGFRCPACHNHGLVLDPASVDDVPLKDIIDYIRDKRNWIDGVTVTGGEPTLRKDLPRLLEILRSLGVMIKLDTNGSNPLMLDEIVHTGLVDSVSMDVKAPLDQETYSRACGVRAPLEAIMRSVKILKLSDVDVTFRTTLIPGMVEEPELAQIKSFLGDSHRYIVQPFRNVSVLAPDLRGAREFDMSRVERMKSIYEIHPVKRMAS